VEYNSDGCYLAGWHNNYKTRGIEMHIQCWNCGSRSLVLDSNRIRCWWCGCDCIILVRGELEEGLEEESEYE
jgi:ribosomal protein S27E